MKIPRSKFEQLTGEARHLTMLNILLDSGILITLGFLLGEAAARVKLPRVSGYIIAGILLNPGILGIIPPLYIQKTDPLIDISLAVITFSIGGSLSFEEIRSKGKMILLLTLFEALFAYSFVFVLLFISINYFFHIFYSFHEILAVSLILASLASPTDPTATLAVTREYKAKGMVSSTIIGIAAFDDITGIILFTFSISIAKFLTGGADLNFGHALAGLGQSVGGAIAIGIAYGLIFNYLTKLFKKESEGGLLVIIIGILLLCYGTAIYLDFDKLISTLALGVMVINFNTRRERVFEIMERYTEELIFVIFFTLSGLHLNLSALSGSLMLIGFFILARALGKYTGIYTASALLKAPEPVKKYTAGGLFPQGGIVIGLALLVAKEPSFSGFSSHVIGIVIGAAVIHELLGPVMTRLSLKKSGEINV